MYYTNSNFINDLEELLRDFLIYRESKKGNEIIIKQHSLPNANCMMLEQKQNENKKNVNSVNNEKNNTPNQNRFSAKKFINEVNNSIQQIFNEYEANGKLTTSHGKIQNETSQEIVQQVISILNHNDGDANNFLNNIRSSNNNFYIILTEFIRSLVENFCKKKYNNANARPLDNYLPY
jgi:hypothetical protein